MHTNKVNLKVGMIDILDQTDQTVLDINLLVIHEAEEEIPEIPGVEEEIPEILGVEEEIPEILGVGAEEEILGVGAEEEIPEIPEIPDPKVEGIM